MEKIYKRKTNQKDTGLAILKLGDFKAKIITSNKWLNSSEKYNSKFFCLLRRYIQNI